MTLIDKIADALLEVHIFEMAYERKVIVSRIRDLAGQVASHVAKISLYPEHTARKHWESEIHAWCKTVDNMKYARANKLKESDYHKLLYTEPFEHTDFVDHISKQAVRSDGMPDFKWSDNYKSECESKIHNFYSRLSNQLSTNSYSHVSNILSDCNL